MPEWRDDCTCDGQVKTDTELGCTRLPIEGVLLEDFCHFLDRARGLRILSELYGKAIQCEMCPYMQFILHYGLKTLFGIERIKVLPALLSSDEALRLVVGFNAQHAR